MRTYGARPHCRSPQRRLRPEAGTAGSPAAAGSRGFRGRCRSAGPGSSTSAGGRFKRSFRPKAPPSFPLPRCAADLGGSPFRHASTFLFTPANQSELPQAAHQGYNPCERRCRNVFHPTDPYVFSGADHGAESHRLRERSCGAARPGAAGAGTGDAGAGLLPGGFGAGIGGHGGGRDLPGLSNGLKCSPSQGQIHLTHGGSMPSGYSPVVM